MVETLFNIENCSVSACGGAKRLDIPRLEIHRGITAVIGPSGSGKTTLLNLLVGFGKPDAGSVLPSVPESHDGIGIYWVPHNGGLWPHMTALEHVIAVLEPGKASVAMGFLDNFDLADKKDRRPGQLSRGECSRLSIARAIASGASILVMDEPLVNIHSEGKRKYWRSITDSVRASGASLVFSTHEPNHVMGYADELLCLDGGRIAYSGRTEELYWNPPSEKLALCLGETNWFTAAECGLWLGTKADSPISLRPEQIRIAPDPGAPFKVLAQKFEGEIAETWLEAPNGGPQKLFFHRPDRAELRKGTDARIEVYSRRV